MFFFLSMFFFFSAFIDELNDSPRYSNAESHSQQERPEVLQFFE